MFQHVDQRLACLSEPQQPRSSPSMDGSRSARSAPWPAGRPPGPIGTSGAGASTRSSATARPAAPGPGAQLDRPRRARSCRVPHHHRAVTRGVAEVVEQLHDECRTWAWPLMQRAPPGLFIRHLAAHFEDRRVVVDSQGLVGRLVVARVRPSPMISVSSSPQTAPGAGIPAELPAGEARRDWQQLEVAKHGLQERQLDLQPVLVGIEAVGDAGDPVRAAGGGAVPIDRYLRRRRTPTVGNCRRATALVSRAGPHHRRIRDRRGAPQ